MPIGSDKNPLEQFDKQLSNVVIEGIKLKNLDLSQISEIYWQQVIDLIISVERDNIRGVLARALSDHYSTRRFEKFKRYYNKFFLDFYLEGDALNSWVSATMASWHNRFSEMTPAMHYAEYFRDVKEKGGVENNFSYIQGLGIFDQATLDFFRKKIERNVRKHYDYIVRKSDASHVAQFDQLVDEYNADLERIKNEKDKEKAISFHKSAIDLCHQMKNRA